jgi:hypothetical protein
LSSAMVPIVIRLQYFPLSLPHFMRSGIVSFK